MAVEDKLGVYDPTEEDMLWLTSITYKECTDLGDLFHADDCDYAITDLSGLEYAHNLESIDFHLNKISSISPLKNLTELEDVRLGRNRIHDLGPLKDLTKLRYLDVHGNGLSDLSPLSGLSNLQTLKLRWNNISDVSPLSGLSNLRALHIHGNKLSDISPLSGLTRLSTLYIYDNQISDISALSGLTNLHLLSAPNNQISELSALAGLSKLSELYLHNNQITDISPLAELTHLTKLKLDNNPLNQQACDIYAHILANNPGMMEFDHDLCFVEDLSGSLSVRTYAAKNVTETSARLEAYLVDDGAKLCEGWFCYWIKGRQAQTELSTSKQGSLQTSQEYVKGVNGLLPDTTYCFQAVAANADGQGEGTVLEFSTLEAVIPTANLIHVDDDAVNDPGPGDRSISDPEEDGTEDHPYDAIQEAIELAQDLDKILVHEGRYYETLNLMGKNLTITRFVPDTGDIRPYPVIDAQNKGTVVTFNNGEDPNCLLSGLVLTGGLHSQCGAIACVGASPTIQNCLIVNNCSTGPDGAIITCEDSLSLFQNLTVSNNSCAGLGSAFRFSDSDAVITNSIIWGNASNEILVASGHDPVVVYSDVQGSWPGNGNIATDPQFALSDDGASPNAPQAIWTPDDYHLLSEMGRWNPHGRSWVTDGFTSPCIDGGDPKDAWTDEPRPHGMRINMGAYGGTHQASCSLHVTPLVAQWTFDEFSGRTASDATGHNHAMIYGASWTYGVLGGGLQFDGIDDYVDCGNDPALAPERFTIALWIQAQAASVSRTILSKGKGNGNNNNLNFELFGARFPTFSFGDGTQPVVLYSSSPIGLNEWTHITLTRDPAEAALYVNGTQVKRQAHNVVPIPTDHSLIIGGGSVQPYQGKIDDVCIYGVVLSEEDIAGLAAEPD